jgi:hypothetical protein
LTTDRIFGKLAIVKVAQFPGSPGFMAPLSSGVLSFWGYRSPEKLRAAPVRITGANCQPARVQDSRREILATGMQRLRARGKAAQPVPLFLFARAGAGSQASVKDVIANRSA